MKHAAITVAALALAACQAGVTATPTSGQSAEVVRGMYEAFARGDVPAVAAAMASDIEWTVAENYIYADGNPYIGPDAVVDGPFTRLAAEWTGFELTLDEVIEAGDRVIVLGRYSGRHNATGSTLDAEFAHVWRVAGGKAVSFHQYTDTLQFATVSGGKAKAPKPEKQTAGKVSGKAKGKATQTAEAGKTGTKKKSPAKRTKSRG